jgi:hypothetical protein
MPKLSYLKCSIPNCHNTVGQHKPGKNKQVCSAHRTHRKNETDKWKMDNGCSNKDGHYGFPCVCSVILDPATLDINHIDGNNMNRDTSNIEILCKMCHTMVTLMNEHHLQPSPSDRRPKIYDPNGLFVGLLNI